MDSSAIESCYTGCKETGGDRKGVEQHMKKYLNTMSKNMCYNIECRESTD